MKNRILVILGLLFVTTSFYTNCSGKHGQTEEGVNQQASTSDQKGFEAFEKGFYKFTIDQGCVRCHAAVVSPFFSSPDSAAAYNAAKGMERAGSKPLVDFKSPATSIFIDYAGNAHCADASCSNPANKDTVKSLIEAWATAETAIDEPDDSNDPGTPVQMGPKYVTAGLTVPATIPVLASNTVAVMRFMGSSLQPAVPALANAIIEVELKMANASEYRFSRLKIAGNTAAVKFTGIHIYVKTAGTAGMGLEDLVQGGLWINVSATAAVFARPANLPTTPLGATPIVTISNYSAQFSTTDVVTLGFDNIE